MPILAVEEKIFDRVDCWINNPRIEAVGEFVLIAQIRLDRSQHVRLALRIFRRLDSLRHSRDLRGQ